MQRGSRTRFIAHKCAAHKCAKQGTFVRRTLNLMHRDIDFVGGSSEIILNETDLIPHILL
jgi:hypothetical protein